MNADNESPTACTAGEPGICQDSHKTAGRIRARSGMATVAYWRSRLYRNTYTDRSGNKVEIPEFYVRMRHDGVTRQVRLDFSDRESAATQALERYLRLETEGWAAIDRRMARSPSTPTIDEFCTLYERATASMLKAPRRISIKTYCRSLKQLARLAGIKQIRELNDAAISKARDAYRAKARKDGRDGQGAENTMAKILRNAAACFSVEARAVMKRQGFAVESPLTGVRRPQKLHPVVALPPDTLSRIYSEAVLLRNGEPDAAPITSGQRKKNKRIVDWRSPHPEAYASVLLAIGAGLRANEIDKARWTWLRKDGAGGCYVDIGEELDFIPKGGTARTVRIQPELYDAITATRVDVSSPYVTGGAAKMKDGKIVDGYRRIKVLRAANLWLRIRGVEKERSGGNPLHRLRKQFGSEMATQFGLFPAMRALGHGSHKVTSDYYAGQTSQPVPSHVRIAR